MLRFPAISGCWRVFQVVRFMAVVILPRWCWELWLLFILELIVLLKMQYRTTAEVSPLCLECLFKHWLLHLHVFFFDLSFLGFFLLLLLFLLLLHLLLLLLSYLLLFFLSLQELSICLACLLTDLFMLCSILLPSALDHLQILFIVQVLAALILPTLVTSRVWGTMFWTHIFNEN